MSQIPVKGAELGGSASPALACHENPTRTGRTRRRGGRLRRLRSVRVVVPVALMLLIAGCGGKSSTAGAAHTLTPAERAAKINLQPSDAPAFRVNQVSTTMMFEIEDKAAKCTGKGDPAAPERSISSPEFIGKTIETNGFLASRVSDFSTPSDAQRFLTASDQNEFAYCLTKAVPAAVNAPGISAQRDTFVPNIMQGTTTGGIRIKGWRMTVAIASQPQTVNTLDYFQLAKGATVVELSSWRVGSRSTISDTALKLLDVVQHRTDSN
jgi:hypothetical protein